MVGGGFIGIEVAESLRLKGLDVTIIEAADQVMAPLDPEVVAFVHRCLRENGVGLRLGAGVEAIGASAVALSDGSTIPADVVVAAIGVRPDSTLAADAGLEVDDRGGIVVDESMRTSDPAIYAVGDAVTRRDALDDSVVMVPLANTANRQGRMVADVIMGRQAPGAGRGRRGQADRRDRRRDDRWDPRRAQHPDRRASRQAGRAARRPVVAYCAVGVRGYLASRILVQAGREAVNLDGGYTTCVEARPVLEHVL